MNKTYHCLIVDDEPPARDILRRYIHQLPMLQLAGECGNALQAVAALKQQRVDLLFLDIQMPQVSGMELIRAMHDRPKVILTTAFEQHALEAFDLDVTDYLLKPIQFERFLKAVMRALPDDGVPIHQTDMQGPVRQQDPLFLYFRADRKMVKVWLRDILYIESLKDYVKIYTVKGNVVTKYSMAALEAMLPGTAFIRAHRSFIVALDKVTSFTPETLDVQQHQIPIGKLYKNHLLKSLS